MPRVLLHIDVLSWLRGASRGEPRQRAKCLDHLRQLSTTGETPFKLTTQGFNKGWRRSQLFGNRFYLWWAPCGTMRQIAERIRPRSGDSLACDPLDAYVRTVTYHDDTNVPVLPDTHRPELWSELTPELLGEISAPANQPGRTGPRVGRGRVHAGDDVVDLDAVRAQREALRVRRPLRRAAGAARGSTRRLDTIDSTRTAVRNDLAALMQRAETLVGKTAAIPAPEPPAPTRLVSPARTAPESQAESTAVAAPDSTASAPADVQQALLDLYGSKLSQTQIARKLGVAQPTFSQWVSGRRRIAEHYWPKILSVAEALRPKVPKVRAKKPVAPPDVQQALLDLYDAKIARAEIARRIGVSAQTFTQWVSGGTVADYYWPLILLVADKVRGEEREAGEFARAVQTLSERHGVENLPKILGVRQSTLADYHKYGVLPARAKMRKAVELAK